MTARPKPRVSDERLAKLMLYAVSEERQGYPCSIGEFANIMQDSIDARAELAAMRPVVAWCQGIKSLAQSATLYLRTDGAVFMSLFALVDTYERGTK